MLRLQMTIVRYSPGQNASDYSYLTLGSKKA